jgi:lysophospholipase L1-like esterase
MLRYFLYFIAAAALILAGLFIAFILVPGRRVPPGNPEYVALGSSYAAGLGLGPRVAGSAMAAGRTINSYPQKFARLAGLALVDMTWSGSKVTDILHSGAFFQRPQIDGVGPQTKLVTITAGGNDVGYGGDLAMMGYRNKGPVLRFLLGLFGSNPRPAAQRDFQHVYGAMRSAITEIKRRAPQAKIVVVTYPVVLPAQGSCPDLRLTVEQVALMRPVADKLAEVTRSAASHAGALVLDMATLSVGHDACSAVPWTRGAVTDETPFHPSNAGTDATAAALRKLVATVE